MKVPEKAPDLGLGPLDKGFSDISFVRKANYEYMYWDTFKYQPMPKDVSPEDAWGMLKFSRSIQMRHIPLADTKGKRFVYWLPEGVQRELHYIDQQAGGPRMVEDPSVHKEEKTKYIIRSLAEEAIASSQIEGAVTTVAVAKEMLRTGRKPKDHAEQMIYNNHLSMQTIKDHLKEPLSAELMCQIHKTMTADTLDDPSYAGRFRTPTDDKICVFDEDGQTILHEPPKAEDVPELMQALCDFANSEKEDDFIWPAVKGILLHFWLAYVHPFMDGNGRTARALFYWYMLKHGYDLFEYVSVSKAILSARTQYYRSFLYSEMDDNDATYFVVYNLRAIHKAMDELNAYIERKQKEKRHAARFLSQYPSLNLRQRALLASALEKPYDVFTIEVHSNIHGVTYQTARTDLLGLRDMGLLEMRKEGRKFMFTPVADLREKLEG